MRAKTDTVIPKYPSAMNGEQAQSTPFDPRSITRPHESLLRYYVIVSAFSLFLFPIIYLHYYIYYRTLWYSFDDEGVRMGWGMFWKREVNLTYRRIQDIHVTRNIIERRMGLASVALQTASGSSKPEATIVGVREADALRDFLYLKMRGARGERTDSAESPAPADADEALVALRDIAASLRTLVEKQGGAR